MCSLLLVWGFKYKVMSDLKSLQKVRTAVQMYYSFYGHFDPAVPHSVTSGRHSCP